MLTYRISEAGSDWKDVQQVISLDWTACQYGGARPWFRCPRCGKRVAILAGYGRLFLCRHCYRLPYASQQETAEDRHYRKIRKLRDRLGASHNLTEFIWKKPKGMHWKTFEQLCDQERAMYQVIAEDMSFGLQKLMMSNLKL